MSYTVKAPVVKVEAGPADIFLRQGDVLPEEVRRECVSHLLDMGMIEEITEPAPEPEPTAEVDAMTVAELKAYAVEHGIDLGEATKKDDIRALIDAASL